jgi:hypoxanthine phosphoribosyltransferase
MVKKTYLRANTYLEDIWRLASAVARSGWKADALVALWRGGAPVGVAVHEFLRHVGGWKLQHMALKCYSYSGIGEASDEVVFEGLEGVVQSLPAGARVLVVDDVFDTGHTAAAIKERLEGAGFEFRIATVYWKSGKNLTSLKPDYYVKDASDDWIVFPHEIEGLTREEMAEKSPFLAGLV